MKNVNLKLIAAALITTMLIPMGTASASAKPNRDKKNYESKLTQQYKDYKNDEEKDEDDDKEESKEKVQAVGKWDWKIEKEKGKAGWKIEKEKAKAEVKKVKEEAKAEAKKTREEVKKELEEQRKIIKENNDKTKEIREDIVDTKKEITKEIKNIYENKLVISEDLLKQINERLEMIKTDIEAINSSKGVISNIYVDIRSQLENKDANGVQSGVENVLSIQEQRYLSLQKLYDDLQVLLNLLKHAEAPAAEGSTTDGQAPSTEAPATVPAEETSNNGQATEETTGSETAAENTTNANESTQPAADSGESTQSDTSTAGGQN